jgi:hypothetical protein
MKHKHHLTPKYCGGSDDPSNLIEVSIVQHAMFHYCNWRLWNSWQDRLAWKTLSGQISNSEASYLAKIEGGKKGTKIWSALVKNDQNVRENFSRSIKSRWLDKKSREKNLQVSRENLKKARMAALSKEAKLKRKETFSKINHQKGSKNSQHGKMWIMNPIFKKVSKINRNSEIPKGWIKGRKMGWKFISII